MWLTESNRLEHLKKAILMGYVGTILMVIGAAYAMEYKDRLYGNKFDWLDFAATIVGGFIGQVLQIVTIVLILLIFNVI